LSYRIGTNGNWEESVGPSGEKQMSFVLNGGMRLNDMWARLTYPEGARPEDSGWYYFDEKGIMQSGCDKAGNWYYCNTETELPYGKMVTGWRLDTADNNWYYLDPVSGAMALGWRNIDGKWYYFSPVGAGVYAYDPVRQRWTYGGGAGRPLGAMYQNEVTPDGYRTGADGAWIQ
jgi:glucan-binding YG repeat protein